MHLTNLGGYTLLVLLAILAPSPIPVPLDWIIFGLIAAGFNPTFVLIIAGIGDVIGTILIYKIGFKGGTIIEEYQKRRNRQEYIIAGQLFHTYGKYSLLLSGVPFLGDALIFLGGFFKLPFKPFFFWFILGKVLWYSILAFLIFLIPQKYLHLSNFLP